MPTGRAILLKCLAMDFVASRKAITPASELNRVLA
jgi:hypothetical protein